MENKLIDRISKLLSLGSGTSFEGEADSALAKAYQLMQENNISMAQVNSASKDDALGYMGEEPILRYPNKEWEHILVNYIAKLFDCQALSCSDYIGQGQMQKRLMIIGREGNRTTTILMYKWIRDKIYEDSYYKASGMSARNSYCLGATNTIARRVRDIKKTAPATDEWGLVPASEVDEWLRKYYPNLIARHASSNIRDANAYMQGQSDGKNIGLNRQFGHQALPDLS